FPHQKTNEYQMARYSNLNQNMMTGVPYDVLNDRSDFRPSVGDRSKFKGSTSLPGKEGLWTTSAGRIDLAEYNSRARGFVPAVQAEPYRYLDEEGVKRYYGSPAADRLYNLSQQGSRTLEGKGSSLRRVDLG